MSLLPYSPLLWGWAEPADPRRRAEQAAVLWLGLTLAAVVVLSALILWHLVRRGRLIRERLGPPRDVRLPEIGPTEPTPAPGDSRS